METNIESMKKDIEALKRAVEEIRITMDIEPEVKPKYVKRLMKISKGKHSKVFNSIEEFDSCRNIPETALLSEKSLAESWLSKEDEEAFGYLQEK